PPWLQPGGTADAAARVDRAVALPAAHKRCRQLCSCLAKRPSQEMRFDVDDFGDGHDGCAIAAAAAAVGGSTVRGHCAGFKYQWPAAWLYDADDGDVGPGDYHVVVDVCCCCHHVDDIDLGCGGHHHHVVHHQLLNHHKQRRCDHLQHINHRHLFLHHKHCCGYHQQHDVCGCYYDVVDVVDHRGCNYDHQQQHRDGQWHGDGVPDYINDDDGAVDSDGQGGFVD
ncbi:hypothetical protein HK405_007106, partial [Cladochytrium tenue]